ncbi:diguanylate cyclase [Ramlibacter sp. H39-3-26]|uniref:GGDEF domain-containing protein n=1 Tax=Curvibacter soli TaxID=3031331 RepID=UPI0023DAC51F|nr:diguanylate cyclase [Ramlibacter sp. H39-3-26]MDF1485302.1 diguanylate cyclase [Ramlibacter sp. H39-3-26]
MPQLHLGLEARSILLVLAVLSLQMAFVLFALRRSYPHLRSLRAWAAAPLLCGIASALIGLRGMIPDAISILAANLLLLTGLWLYYAGSQQMVDLEPAPWRWSVPLAAVVALLAWFTYGRDDFEARAATMAASIAVVCARHAWLLARRLQPTLGTRLTFYTALAAIAVKLMLLCFTFGWWSGYADPAGKTLALTFYFIGSAITMPLANLGVILMVTERLRGVFEQLATHDALTGALSRRALLDACAEELERSRRRGHAMALLLLDLDHFKAVNDTYGHQTGDRVLAGFARRVRDTLRIQDRFGRYGGEEFVALLPETDLPAAQVAAERIRQRVSMPSPSLPRCTVSIGLATLQGPGDGIDAMLARADHALYRAKHSGRNRVGSL